MKIVIDIPDDIYSAIVKQYRKDKELQTRDNLYKAIVNGIPLPKGHGRLIDADDIDNHIIGHINTRSCPTIIEADGGDTE